MVVDGAGNGVRYGFIGLGDQGAPIARRVIDAGYPTVLWARRATSLDPFRDTPATFADSLADLAERCTMVGVCVRTDADAEAVLSGPAGLLALLAPGSTVLLHSTIAPALARALAATGLESGVIVVDAPVSGGRSRATAGQLSVMVGASPADFERVLPVLKTFADTIELLGEAGAGQLCKLLNNVTFTINLGAAIRVFQSAATLGVDHGAVARALGAGSGQSFALDTAAMASSSNLEQALGLLSKDVDLFRGIADDESARELLVLADAALGALRVTGAA
jgi:3-hydroxyisobutyrate dehydrogenase